MMTRESTSRVGVVGSIQYLRAAAALMVVWHHSYHQLPGLREYLPPSFGALGVDVFFVISGFIMVATTSSRAMSGFEFLVRRVVRVVPLYWAVTLLTAGLSVALPRLFRSTDAAPAYLLQSLLFIPYWSPTHPGRPWPVLVPGWSLNYEMFFYILFALSFALPPRSRVATLSAALLVLAAFGMAFQPFDSALATVFTGFKLLEFVAGMVVAQAWLRDRLVPSARVGGAMLVSGALLLGAAGTAFSDESRRWAVLVASTLLVAGALAPAFRDSRHRWLAALGNASYSIYLTHLLTLGVLRFLWPHIVSDSRSPLAAGLFVISAIAASAVVGLLCYRYVESPLTRRLSARVGRWKAGRPIAAPLRRAAGAESKE